MKITKKKAISECKELWEEIEESGLSKSSFLEGSAGKKWLDREYECDCPLCEYALDCPKCPKCPLVKQYGEDCYALGFKDNGKIEPSFFDAIRGLK